MIVKKNCTGLPEAYDAACQSENIWIKMSIERNNNVKTYFYANYVAPPGRCDELDEYEDFSDELKNLFLPDCETETMECELKYNIIRPPKKFHKQPTKNRFRMRNVSKTVTKQLRIMTTEILTSQLTGDGGRLVLYHRQIKGTKSYKDTQQEDTLREDTLQEDTLQEDTPKEDAQQEDAPKEDTQQEDTQQEDTQQEDAQPDEELPKEVIYFYEKPLEKSRKRNYRCVEKNTSNIESDEKNSDIE